MTDRTLTDADVAAIRARAEAAEDRRAIAVVTFVGALIIGAFLSPWIWAGWMIASGRIE